MYGTSLVVVYMLVSLVWLLTKKRERWEMRRLHRERMATKQEEAEEKYKRRYFRRMGWKYDPDMEVTLTKKGISFGRVSIRPSLWGKTKARARDPNVGRVLRIAGSLLAVIVLFRLTGNAMSLFVLGAAFTDKAAGNWNASGQTTWNEVGTPGTTDTVTIDTYTITMTQSEACLSISVEVGGTLIIDAVGNSTDITLTWDDAANSGFYPNTGVDDNNGTVTCIGSSSYHVYLASAAEPPSTDEWWLNCNLVFTADYTTFSYFKGHWYSRIDGGKTWDIDNCEYEYSESFAVYFRAVTITSFTNNTIDNAGNYGIVHCQNCSVDNITITNSGTADIGGSFNFSQAHLELNNSSFSSFGQAGAGTWPGEVISHNHNDVAGDWYTWSQDGYSSGSHLKSDITLDYTTGDTVVIAEGKFIVDEASACFDMDIKSGAEFKIDAVGASASLTHTWDDTVDAGIISTSAGTLTCVGNGTYSVTITSENTPPTNYWNNNWYLPDLSITVDYTTFSYMYKFGGGGVSASYDIDNCTFDHGNYVGFYIPGNVTVTSFDNNTFDNCVRGLGVYQSIVIDNAVFTNNSVFDIVLGQSANPVEFTNSNFDISKVSYDVAGWLISDTHNDTANDYYIWIASGDTADKSDITTNDYGTGDNVIVYTGIFTVDEASASFTLDVKSGATWKVDAVGATASLTHTWDDASGAGFINESAGAIICVGSATYGVILTSENTSPTDRWNAENNNGDADWTLDYTTFNYYASRALWSGATIDVDNCNFNYSNAYGAIVLFTNNCNSFTNININCVDTGGFGIYIRAAGYTNFDNITITNGGSLADSMWVMDGNDPEFNNSTFDEAKVHINTSGSAISHNHNDVSGDWYFWGGSVDMNKSSYTLDYTTGDNVVIYTGTLNVNEASASKTIDILSGATWKIDAVTASASLTHTWDDISGCGFIGTIAGTLECVGNATYGVTITSVGSPPTTHWNADITATWTSTLTYTTIEYFDRYFGKSGHQTWTDVTLRYQNLSGSTVLNNGRNISWTNVTINANAKGIAVLIYAPNSFSGDNITITNVDSDAWYIGAYQFEVTNSSFEATKVNIQSADAVLISDTHNDVAGDWYYWSGATGMNKSLITNDYGTGDAVVIYTGLLTVNNASACETLLIMTGAEWKVDAVGASASLTHEFDDVAGCGFVNSADFDGTLTCNGSVTYTCTITSAGAPSPGVTWNAQYTGTPTINLTYTTIEYFYRYFGVGANVTWNDVTFQDAGATYSIYIDGATTNSLTNVSIDANGRDTPIVFWRDTTDVTNLSITNGGSTVEIRCWGANRNIEMTNSNFDVSKVEMRDTATLISDNHNDVSGDWYYWGGTATTRDKSDITNDYATGDVVTIYTGTFVVDVASACFTVEIMSGAEWKIDAVSAAASLTHTWDDTASAGFAGVGTGTWTCTGNATYGVTITSTGSPPTEYWRVYTNDTIFAMTYTTWNYHYIGYNRNTSSTYSHCNFNNAETIAVQLSREPATFSDITIDNTITGLRSSRTVTNMDNVVITNCTTDVSVNIDDKRLELNNSNFDITKVSVSGGAGRHVISDNHNDVANAYYVWAGTSIDKSLITNDYGTGDAVVIYEGTLVVNVASACKTLLIMTGAEWKVDAVGAAASLTHTWDDASGAGFDSANVGTLTCIGNATYGATLTSAGSPPTYYWAGQFNTLGGTISLAYTTLDYGNGFTARGGTPSITNVTMSNGSGLDGLRIWDVTGGTFTNITMTGTWTQSLYLLSVVGSLTLTNVDLDGTTATRHLRISVNSPTYIMEFINSNFDPSDIYYEATRDDPWISKNHDDASGNYLVGCEPAHSFDKSDIVNDFGATDNVTIYTGTLVADINLAHTDMTIKDGATLTVNQNLTHTITHTTGRITVESGGTLNWNGASGNTVTLQSSSQGTQWEIDLDSGGTINASWCLVRDSNATVGLEVDGTDNCTDVDNNDNWDFGGAQYKDTISGIARIKGLSIKDIISGLARIKGISIKDTLSGLARIKEISIKDIISGNARVSEQIKDIISGEARILGEIKDTISGFARIVAAGVVKDTISGLARIKGTSIKDVISGLARIKEISIKDTISGNSRILEVIKDTIGGTARILGEIKDVIGGSSRIKDINIKDVISGEARVKGENIKDIASGIARIKEVSIKDTISGGARILEVIKDSVSGLARIKGLNIKNIMNGYAKIVTFAIHRNTMNGYARIIVDVRVEFEYLAAVDGRIYMEAI